MNVVGNYLLVCMVCNHRPMFVVIDLVFVIIDLVFVVIDLWFVMIDLGSLCVVLFFLCDKFCVVI